MAFLWDKAVGMYYQYVVEATDSRVKSWPLMGSPMTMLTIIAGYIYFVKVWGPSWMKGREPFQIKGVLIAYNLIMVVLSTLFFVVGGSYTYLGPYNWLCQPVSYGRDPDSMAVTTLGWWYLLLKMVEFLDTVFFVLTKKFSHISLLHVVHHSTVAWTVWMGVNYGAGGQNAFFPFINCFVHIFQMVQFVIGFVHAAIPVFYDCGFPPYFAYILMGEAVLLFYMFRNFYAKAYKASQTARNVQQRNGHVKTAVTTGTDGTQAKLGLIVRSMSNHGLVPHRGGSMTTPVTS
ncbi:hypothetical protein HPB51_014118 [Rhipicephalus microplus]|uniref:Elongation of very long chain fatty acids protein n=1 Tax=Rhipicephalus microplus TaxID=6941 RepID=A0A9J6DUR8_RHIMP|nr:hypothetical protein HPB51_014118 [Rhipicephalus microplus]